MVTALTPFHGVVRSSDEDAKVGRHESVFGGGLGVAVADFAADAQAEVNEGREADHEADIGVEAFKGREREKADRTVVRHGVAEDGEGGGEHFLKVASSE